MKRIGFMLVTLFFATVVGAERVPWHISNYETFRTISGGNEVRLTVTMGGEKDGTFLFAPTKVCGKTVQGTYLCSEVQISEMINQGESRSFLVRLPQTETPLIAAWFEQ